MDGVYPFTPGSGGLNVEQSPRPHGIADSGDPVIAGTKSARGLIDTTQLALYDDGSAQLAGSAVYGAPSSWKAISSCAVHAAAGGTTTAEFEFDLLFRGHSSSASGYSDIDAWRVTGTASAGSDFVEVSLDSALHSADPGNPFAAPVVDYGAEPRLSEAHLNHSIVWPWRVRASRTTGVTVGFYNADSADHSPLAECRVFKFTDSNGVTQYCLYLVWYGEDSSGQALPPGEGTAVISSDYILLAAYTALGNTPSNLESPFFHVPQGATEPEWDAVNVRVTASLTGFVTMTVESLVTGHTETLTISGQPPAQSVPTDGSGNPVGISHVDVGCSYASATAYGHAVEGPSRIAWSMDQISGSDVSLLQSGGTLLLYESFDTALSSNVRHAVPLSAYPRAQGDDVLFIGHCNYQAGPGTTSAINWYAQDAEPVLGTALAGELSLDLNNGPFGGNNRTNTTARLTPSVSGGGVGITSDVLAFYWPYPTFGTVTGMVLGAELTGAASPAVSAMLRFSNTQGASSADYPGYFEAGEPAGAWNYFIRVPEPLPRANSTGSGRDRQTELCLFSDGVVQTASGADGTGTPPVGVGLRVRLESSPPNFVVELYVQGTPTGDRLAAIVGLESSAWNIMDLVLECEDLGDGNLEFHVWANGRRFATNAAGTGDFTLAKSQLAGFKHGIGVHAAADLTGIAPKQFIHNTYSSNGIAAGPGLYQKGFRRKVDASHAEYVYSTVLPTKPTELDYVAMPDSTQTSLPYYLRGGRVRGAVAAQTGYISGEPFSVYSLISAGHDESEPFDQIADPNGAISVTADFPLLLDRHVYAGTRSTHLIAYRGISIRATGDDWEDLATVANSPSNGVAYIDRSTYVPKGVSVLVWGNPSDTGTNDIKSVKVQLIAISDTGTKYSTSQLLPTGLGTSAEGRHLRVTLVESLDPDTGDRTYDLSVFNQQVGGEAFNAVPLGNLSLTLTAAQFSDFGSHEVCIWRYHGYRAAASTVNKEVGFNTTWLTSYALALGMPDLESRYKSAVSVHGGSPATMITSVRGLVEKSLIKRLRDVRGLMEGALDGDPIEAVTRRLLVFEADDQGRLPGSVGHAHTLGDPDVNYYSLGAQIGNDIWWGGPVQHFTDASLRAHQIEILEVAYADNTAPQMTIRQEGIHFSGGHLRVGQFVVLVEHVGSAQGFDLDPDSGLIYGDRGVKILFRGVIQQCPRDVQRGTVTYIATGLEGVLEQKTILEMTDCGLGKFAYNVEEGSPNTPFAVSTNHDYKNGPPNQNSPENYGSMLGPGIPDLKGMTLADIVEHFINFFRVQLNEAGTLRLNSQGRVTVANADGSDVEFSDQSELGDNNIADPIEAHTGPAATASIVWAPNRDAFSIFPPETLVSGNVAQIIRGLMATMPNVRWRIEPGTLRWVFETRQSLSAVTISADTPGTLIQLADDATQTATAVLFSSPWRKEERFLASLKDGTLRPHWLPSGFEGEWMQPMSQIGSFQGEITQVQNFPYQDLGIVPSGPFQTVMKVKVNTLDQNVEALSFDGASFKLLDGMHAGKKGTIVSSYAGGSAGGYRYFDIVVEPAFPGSYGTGTEVTVGTLVQVSDDPTEGTTEETNAYARVWADYVIVEPNSGRPLSDVTGGSFGLTTPVGGCDSDVYQTINVSAAVINGENILAAFPLTAPGTSCSPGGAQSPTECGGDIVFDAARIQEGTWCARSPASGFAGSAYKDIREYEGIVTSVDNDGLGFEDRFASWIKNEWEPIGGSFTKVLLIGGHQEVFRAGPAPLSTTEDLNISITDPFTAGWVVNASDVLQDTDPLFERSLDPSDDVAQWHVNGGGADTWETTPGIAFKEDGTLGWGRTRGCVLTRFAPSQYGGAQDFDPETPLSESGLNSNHEVQLQITLDPLSTVDSLAQVGVVLRAENGYLEQRRMPPLDVDGATPLFPGNADSLAEKEFFERDEVTLSFLAAAPYDYIPEWLSPAAGGRSFKDTSIPLVTGVAEYNAQPVLGGKGRVIDARFGGYVDISAEYTGTAAGRKRCGLEHGTTGYVFRLVRGDEEDCRIAGAASGQLYPTLFWYHTRRVVDSVTGDPILDNSGEPIFEGVKEILYQPVTPITAINLSTGTALTLSMAVETPATYGLHSRFTMKLDGLVGLTVQPVYEFTHNASAIRRADGNLEQFVMSGFDGNYHRFRQGFSLVRGGGGFGCGVVKSSLARVSNPVLYSTARPAKVRDLRVKRINRPIFDSVAALPDVAEEYFETAKVGRVMSSSERGIRFQHDPTHPETGYTPAAGDRYKLIVDRGWGIAKTATYEAAGLDDPNKVWIFKHMADSALAEMKDRRYTGSITVPGIAYELLAGGVNVNLKSAEGFTGLEAADQPVGGVRFLFSPQRQTVIAVSNDGRGRFSQLEQLLQREAEKKAVFQGPYWLGQEYQLVQGIKQQRAATGRDLTTVPGFSGTANQPTCSQQVYSGTTGQPLDLDLEALIAQVWRLEIMIEANKGEEDDPNNGGSPFEFSRGQGGIAFRGALTDRARLSSYLLRKESISTEALMDDTYAFEDGDGRLYSPYLVQSSVTGRTTAIWTPVEEVEGGRYAVVETELGRKPRESGSTIIAALIDGSASSYVVNSRFRKPVVRVVAQAGYAGPGGATAGEHLNSANCTGFKIVQNTTDDFEVTISASSTFGPCDIYLSS